MIEKMAKQIAEDFGVKPFLEYENNKTFYENVAKSALKAMLEPTEEILNVSIGSIYWTNEEVWKMFIQAIDKK